MVYDIHIQRKGSTMTKTSRRPMVSHAVVDKFHSILMDDDQFNEALMRVALEVVQSYAPGEALTEDDLQLAMDLCTRVAVA